MFTQLQATFDTSSIAQWVSTVSYSLIVLPALFSVMLQQVFLWNADGNGKSSANGFILSHWSPWRCVCQLED